MKIYRDITDNITPWLAQHRPLLKRFIYKLYRKYVDETYIPREVNVDMVRQRQKGHPRYGEITHIKIRKGNDTANEYYLFNQFGNQFNEHKM